MGVLTGARSTRENKVKHLSLPLAIGAKAFPGGIACVDWVAMKLVQGQPGAGLEAIGEFENDVAIDNSAGGATVQVLVNLDYEIELKYYDNDTVSPVLAANTFGICFILDDHTVTMNPAGASAIGRIWDVDSVQGVGVQKLPAVRTPLGTPAAAALGAFVANDLAPAAGILQQDAVYDIPATGAASTVTLPAAAPDGTRLTFCADGTKNTQTVQYRDATGPTNLTTALTAAKRHLTVCVKENGKWFANAYVSP